MIDSALILCAKTNEIPLKVLLHYRKALRARQSGSKQIWMEHIQGGFVCETNLPLKGRYWSQLNSIIILYYSFRIEAIQVCSWAAELGAACSRQQW